jgi:exonuclease SbcC
VGESDSGKSTILRALNWVVNNKPSGEAFRSNWGGSTVVYLSTNDFIIGRAKDKDSNYSLIQQGKPAEYFNSFGQDVPEEIKKLLNISSLSLQSQFSSPFLLSMSSGEVAKYLNKIVHLDKIDTAISNINKTLREEKQDLKYAEEALEEQRESVKQYSWLNEAGDCLDKLEIIETKLRNSKDENRKLGLLTQRIEECEGSLKKYSKLEKAEEELEKALKLSKEIAYQVTSFTDLEKSIYIIEEVEEDLEGFINKITEWEREFKKLMPDVCPLCGRGD